MLNILNKEKIFESVASSSPDAFIGIDENNKIKYSNKRFEEVTGWKPEELEQFDFFQVISLPAGFDLNSLSISHNKISVPIQITQRGGNELMLQARCCKVEKDSGISYIIIAYAETRAQVSSEKAHMEFVSTISHELRTPLTSIKGFADTLIRSSEKIPEDTKKKYINIIREQANRLSRLVEDLLAVSRLESRNFQLTIRSIDPKDSIRKVCDALSEKSTKHKLITDIEKDIPDVKADLDRLDQILTNLVDNAIKYSPNGSKVIVKAMALKNSDGIKDKVKIDVTDNGIGIQENDLKKIFTRFGRLDHPLTRQTEGTGLGLYITKSLVLALNGEISVESKEGETVFTVILPADISHKGIAISSGGTN